ncbi:uncharacterized protein LOC143039013 [Oratosquilla oratoria]|uniref:uncharacterized protein LOC143039013 n=1 Tax=Oratosquilla oratoria TaxID=337810 RepID=UPI003F7672A5
MGKLLRLLAVKGLRTTHYHPMCNGLSERFSGILKKMLKRMEAEQPKEWPCANRPRFIAPLLFAYLEVPQASLQFSPFELVYGRSVRGPLQVLRELWDEEEPDPAVKTTYSYVLDLAKRLRETCKVAKQELLKAKEVQKSYYDKKTKPRILEKGDQCLLLLPTAHNKLLSQWQGIFEVVKRLSDLNYRVELVESQFKQLQMVCAAVVVPEIEELVDYAPLTTEAIQCETVADVQVFPRLSPEQKRHVDTILQRHSAVFSDKPGVAKVDCHEIRLTSSMETIPNSHPSGGRSQEGVRRQGSCSPIVVVRKKDGGVRICGDYHGVNAVTQLLTVLCDKCCMASMEWKPLWTMYSSTLLPSRNIWRSSRRHLRDLAH